MTTTIIDFIRHGEPVGGARYRGSGIDDPLTEKGWRQMRSSVIDPVPWTRIVSSPLRRCSEFALDLGQHHNIPVILDDRFKEVGFGAWEGRSREELLSTDGEEYEAFYQDPVNNRPHGAEPLHDFAARVEAAYDEVIAVFSGEHVLVVGHAGVIRAALGYVLQAPSHAWYRIKVDNAALTRFHHDVQGSRLIFSNLGSGHL